MKFGRMRPSQECLLLASGLDVRRPDDPFQAQTVRLREFVRAMLTRKPSAGGPLRNVDLSCDVALPAPPEERALLPVEPAQALVAFDLPALLHAPHLRKHAVLAPLALARDMGRIAAAADPMPVLAALQDALRHAYAVVVFDDAMMRDLALLGAGDIAALPLPALSLPPLAPLARSDVPDRASVCVFDHEPARGRAAALAAAVSAARPAAAVPVAADGAAAAPGRGLHLHLGAGSVGAAWRVVDSFAAGCPVVQLADGPARAERLGPTVAPMRTGILASVPAEAVAGVVRLASDAALVDAFRAQAGRAAEAFNRGIEDRLRDLSP